MAKKFVSTADVSAELVSLAISKGIAKKGPGKTLQVKKGEEFSNVSIDALEKLEKWLEAKTAPTKPLVKEVKIKTAPVPEDWSRIFIELPNIGGNSFKRMNCQLWTMKMLEEGVSPSQARWIIKKVFLSKTMSPTEKIEAIGALKSEKSTFNSTWVSRITK
ncbi:MAG: hypothetical protein ACRC0G_01295, partial [Fusobacteriaceae bacterium]